MGTIDDLIFKCLGGNGAMGALVRFSGKRIFKSFTELSEAIPDIEHPSSRTRASIRQVLEETKLAESFDRALTDAEVNELLVLGGGLESITTTLRKAAAAQIVLRLDTLHADLISLLIRESVKNSDFYSMTRTRRFSMNSLASRPASATGTQRSRPGTAERSRSGTANELAVAEVKTEEEARLAAEEEARLLGPIDIQVLRAYLSNMPVLFAVSLDEQTLDVQVLSKIRDTAGDIDTAITYLREFEVNEMKFDGVAAVLAKLEQRVQTDELLVTDEMRIELSSYLGTESKLFSESEVVISVRNLDRLLKKIGSLGKTKELMQKLDEAGAKVASPCLSSPGPCLPLPLHASPCLPVLNAPHLHTPPHPSTPLHTPPHPSQYQDFDEAFTDMQRVLDGGSLLEIKPAEATTLREALLAPGSEMLTATAATQLNNGHFGEIIRWCKGFRPAVDLLAMLSHQHRAHESVELLMEAVRKTAYAHAYAHA